MTKNEYISALGRELKRLGVPDAGDVLEEYEQHFAFKGADGRTEEEIAARLGAPAEVAAQFAAPGAASGSAAFVRALMRSWARFAHNSVASASGRAVLPPLPAVPRLSAKAGSRARLAARISLAVFAACFVLGAVISMISAGALGFWHVWNWFGYAA